MIEIYLDGKLVLTTGQVAGKLGVKPGTVRARASKDGIEPIEHLDPRTPLWNPEDFGLDMGTT